MDKKKLLLLGGAGLAAILMANVGLNMVRGSGSPQAAAAAKVEMGSKVLVAQRALPVGTIITADSIGFKAWPKEMVQDAYFLEGEADMQKLLGTVVRNPITAGEPITQGSLVAPGDRGFLAAALGPGMRAVTIPVSARTGVAGFVFPGDHIDLVLTQTVKGNDPQPLKASETIIRNLRVLATDQSATQEQVEGKTKVKAFSTVTVEVTPKIAEKIAVAQTIGTLSLSLRSLADNSAELEQAIASGDVKVPAGASPQDEEKLLKQALAHPLDGGTSFATGGDVSRFQRKSMPPMGAGGSGGFTAPPAPAPATAVAGPVAPPRPRGPVVNITRGKETVTVSVGGQ
jgi:pilus assembly protein CpaB